MDETYVGGKPRKGTHYDDPDDRPKPGPRHEEDAWWSEQWNGMVKYGRRWPGSTSSKAKTSGPLSGRRVDTAQAHLMTDEYKGYLGMGRILPHDVVKHDDWYVDGDIHTNTIEGFWALLKRGIAGQFHHVSRRHLQRYVDEFCYRYNLRKVDSDEAFAWTLLRGLGVEE